MAKEVIAPSRFRRSPFSTLPTVANGTNSRVSRLAIEPPVYHPRLHGGIELTALGTREDLEFARRIATHQEFFDDPQDTTLHMKGIRYVSYLLSDTAWPRRILDLGAGISFPLTVAFEEKLFDEAWGIEINPRAVTRGKQIASLANVFRPSRYHNEYRDIMDGTLLDQTANYKPSAIVANLPYLPEDPGSPDPTKDGGTDGLKYISQQLKLAQHSQALVVGTNFSSVTTPSELLPMFQQYGYLPHKAFVYTAPFGPRTSDLLDKGVLQKEFGHEYFSQSDVPLQLMINLICVREDFEYPGLNISALQDMIETFSSTKELVFS